MVFIEALVLYPICNTGTSESRADFHCTTSKSMALQFLTPYQPSAHDSTQTLQLEYEVTHHQNCGQDQLLITRIGTFSSLQDAQDAAQDVLRSMLDDYISKGWSGYYCMDIDLDYIGLITGLIGAQNYECLSEIHIHARERVYEYNNSYSEINTTSATGGLNPDSFSQTRPQYPDRPLSFVPRSSAQYDQTMSFATRRDDNPTMEQVATSHSQNESESDRHGRREHPYNHRQRYPETDSFVGNSLRGGYDIGEPYLGRRHSSIDLPSENKQFQHAVEEH